jgi:hypothetical protein
MYLLRNMSNLTIEDYCLLRCRAIFLGEPGFQIFRCPNRCLLLLNCAIDVMPVVHCVGPSLRRHMYWRLEMRVTFLCCCGWYYCTVISESNAALCIQFLSILWFYVACFRKGRSQWPQYLKHEPFGPLEHWGRGLYVCVRLLCVCIFLSVCSGLELGWSLSKDTSRRYIGLWKWEKLPKPRKWF